MTLRRVLFLAALAMGLAGPPFAGTGQAQSTDPSFNLVNRSGQTILEAYVSPSTDTNWGVDRLGRDVVPNGQSYAIRLPAGQCVNDIRVVYQDRRAEERRNLNTCSLTDVEFRGQSTQAAPAGPGAARPPGPAVAAPGGSAQGNPSFNLVNNTGRIIREAYASLSTETNWGEDRLGADTVAIGRNYPIRLPEGPCIYDVRIVLDNNQAMERRNLNLCDITNLAFPQ
ncbi:hypothetical protein [Plastoroseomonas arctica]|uniref:Secreted protein n=1 Tax=Plastoroseomonas arctica TaxID=1509237 RepID=A0AAF1KHS3_9PROT|nr:hypothetical protein [Plastoroseomonas arctica]MBR0654254.1 hypothetical protein [Plastoroseomonas arctica]